MADGFNPHPLRRAGATTKTTAISTRISVSILTRSEERVQPGWGIGTTGVFWFQSSPAPKSGCNQLLTATAREEYKFQSSPAPKSGCNLNWKERSNAYGQVSILTRSEERVQLELVKAR